MGLPQARQTSASRWHTTGLILRSLGQGQTIKRDILLLTELGQTTGGVDTAEKAWRSVVRDRRILRWRLMKTTAPAFSSGTARLARSRLTARSSRPPIGWVAAAGQCGARTRFRRLSMRRNWCSLVRRSPIRGLPPAARSGKASPMRCHTRPSVFRSLKRAVTAEDYEALALDFKGVGKVRAEGTSWNIVTLFVAPAGGGQVSDVLEANLLAYFEDKRPVSTMIDIEDVDYVPIYVTAGGRGEALLHQRRREGTGATSRGHLLAFENVDFGRPSISASFMKRSRRSTASHL